MPSNFIFFTDVHLKPHSKGRRTDDLFDSQLKKIRSIAKLAKDLKSDFVVCGGDLGDTWDWKISVINRVHEEFSKFECPVYSIIGNHDVPGRNPSLWKDTALGILNSLGSIKVIVPDPKIKAYKFEAYTYLIEKSFELWAFHSDEEITHKLINNLSRKPIVKESGNKKLFVGIIHAPVGAEATPHCLDHKNVVINDLDVALFGDIHTGWPIYKSSNGCTLVNPGSLTRLTKADMNRLPQVAVVYSNGKVVYKKIPCLPKEECFDILKMDEEKQNLGKGFLAAIESKYKVSEEKPIDFVHRIGTKAKFSSKSIKRLQDEL